MNIKYIIFDLDGVLFDGAPIHRKAFINALSTYGVTSETYHLHFSNTDIDKSLSSKQKIERINNCENVCIPFEKFYELKNKLFNSYIVKMGSLYKSNVYDMIYDLYLDGYILGLATNCHRNSAIQILSRMDIIHFFRSISSAYDVKKPKPANDVILKCYSDFGIKDDPTEQEKSIYFDDTKTGIMSARNTPTHEILTSDISSDDITYNYTISKIKDVERKFKND